MKKLGLLSSHYAALGVFLLLQLFPLYWMLITAFKSPEQTIATPPIYRPTKLNFDSFERIFSEFNFGSYLRNSAVSVIVALIITVAVSSLAAYGFARWEFPGKGVTLGLLMLTAMLPFISVLGPTFSIIRSLDLLDSRTGLVLVFVSGGIPLATWFLYVFFQTIPVEIEEAAALDGASPLQILTRVVLPLSGPALASTAALVFISYWNEFVFALVLTLTPDSKTLTVGLSEIPGRFETPYDLMAAAGIVTAIPAIVLVLFFQRRIVDGIVTGAVK